MAFSGFEDLVVDEVLAVNEVIEEGDAGEFFDHSFIGDHGGIKFVLELVEDDASTGQALCFNGIDGELDVIEGAKLVGGDNQHGQAKVFGEVGDLVVLGDGDLPATCAFDDDDVVFIFQLMKWAGEFAGVDCPVFQHASDVRSDCIAEVDRVDRIDGEVARGRREDLGIVPFAADDGFVADGIGAAGAQRFDDQAADISFANAGVGSSDE